MTKVNEEGRCVECNCIPRPDIARLKGEDHCKCDPEFNSIYMGMQKFLNQNQKNIETLASSLNRKKDK